MTSVTHHPHEWPKKWPIATLRAEQRISVGGLEDLPSGIRLTNRIGPSRSDYPKSDRVRHWVIAERFANPSKAT